MVNVDEFNRKQSNGFFTCSGIFWGTDHELLVPWWFVIYADVCRLVTGRSQCVASVIAVVSCMRHACRRIGAEGSYLTLVRVADRILQLWGDDVLAMADTVVPCLGQNNFPGSCDDRTSLISPSWHHHQRYINPWGAGVNYTPFFILLAHYTSVGDRVSETQLQAGKNSDWSRDNLRPTLSSKSAWLPAGSDLWIYHHLICCHRLSQLCT